MKQSQSNSCPGMVFLSPDELHDICGGSFWYDLAYATAAFSKGVIEFGKTAMEFQHSLPANLKK